MEMVSGAGERREADPGMVAHLDQMQAHFDELTRSFLNLRAKIKEADLDDNQNEIARLTREMDALVRAELPEPRANEVNYIMYLIDLVEQAQEWTLRNFEVTDALISLLGATAHPDHPLLNMPGFGKQELDKKLEAVLDALHGVSDNTDTFTTATGVTLSKVHAAESCEGTFCVVHKPAPGPWEGWDTHWREDWRLMVRICPHGVHHVAVEEMLRMPLLGMIGHDHPEGCDCPCDLARCTAATDEEGNVLGFQANA